MMILSKRFNSKAIGAYVTAVAICSIILIWVTKLWIADLSIPFSYIGDSIFTGVLVKGLIDNGWYLNNPFLSAPYEQYFYDFPLSNNLDFIILRIISLFGPNYAGTMNLYFLLTFPLTTLTSMLVLRQLKISYPISILGSLLFAFLHYHFWRGEGHLFLAAYYMIPPMILVLFWIYADKDFFISEINGKIRTNLLTRKSIISIFICILISSTFIYYPFFSCFFLIIAGTTSSISHKSRTSLIASIILIALITIGVLINISPTLMYDHENGKNPLTAIRLPQEAELYGLKITLLLLPITDHYIPFMANIGIKYISTAPLTSEGDAPSLGIIIGTGFLLLIGWIFYRLSEGSKFKIKQYYVLNELSTLNLSALLLGTIGAFGSIFAYAVAYLFPLSPQFRAYDRISIFIAFFSMTAIAILLEKLSERYAKTNAKKLFFLALLGILLIAGIMDQTGKQTYETTYSLIKAEYLNDQDFVNRIELIMPTNAMIFQLPYMSYPEYGNMYKMTDYSHFKGYLHSSKLRWSYGAMKGRPEDAWQSGIASETIGDSVKMLSLAGFSGIYVDSYGYEDGGIGVIANLSNILKAEPLISKDKRLFFFDMTNYNHNKPALGYVQLGGWSGIQYPGGIPTRWMSNDAMTEIFTSKNQTVNMSFDVISFYRPRTLEIFLDGNLSARMSVPTNFIGTNVSLNLKKGKNDMRFHVPEGCENPSAIPELRNSDPRCLSLAIQNITITR